MSSMGHEFMPRPVVKCDRVCKVERLVATYAV